ncbi:hypothetical protein AB0J63_01565 [Streptosporangium canum]|uniref:hypothetical protein n=1 Tax=Streptosporangium canum TaxID=324952 RepID=UPI0034489ACC
MVASAIAAGAFTGPVSAAASASVTSASDTAASASCGKPVAFPGGDTWSFYPVRKLTFKGRTLWLRNVRATDYSYAYIKSGYRAGDLVTVQRSKDRGKTKKVCGPFARDHSNQQSNYHVSMRACIGVRVSGALRSDCTDWYYDKG